MTTAYDSEPGYWQAHWQEITRKWPDLARVVDAWPKLDAAIKAGIVAMVNAASP